MATNRELQKIAILRANTTGKEPYVKVLPSGPIHHLESWDMTSDIAWAIARRYPDTKKVFEEKNIGNFNHDFRTYGAHKNFLKSLIGKEFEIYARDVYGLI